MKTGNTHRPETQMRRHRRRWSTPAACKLATPPLRFRPVRPAPPARDAIPGYRPDCPFRPVRPALSLAPQRPVRSPAIDFSASGGSRQRLSTENVDVRSPRVDTIAFLSCDFAQHTRCTQRIDGLLSRRFGRPQQLTCSRQSHHRVLRKMFKQAEGIDCCRLVPNCLLTIVSENLIQPLSCRDAVVR
jgi:hypothetical protein